MRRERCHPLANWRTELSVHLEKLLLICILAAVGTTLGRFTVGLQVYMSDLLIGSD